MMFYCNIIARDVKSGAMSNIQSPSGTRAVWDVPHSMFKYRSQETGDRIPETRSQRSGVDGGFAPVIPASKRPATQSRDCVSRFTWVRPDRLPTCAASAERRGYMHQRAALALHSG